ncbi:MAG: hypothetical protein K2K24_02885, partial [Clostridia bacterium]|nr:hypothetical protein [Clostridia bacterium]
AEFIEIPDNISWQHVQNATISASTVYDYNNDALDQCQVKPYPGAAYNYESKTDYSNWAEDKIWLPSITEIGGYNGNTGLWKLESAQRSNETNINTWTRSARPHSSYQDSLLVSAGNSYSDASVKTPEQGIRPAFHLNLAKVAEKATAMTPKTKGDTLKYHTGNDVTFELEMVNKNFVKVEFSAEYLDSDYTNVETAVSYSGTPSYASGIMSFKVQNVGIYTVKVTPEDGHCWSDGTKITKTYTYTLKYKVAEPKFSENSATSIEKTYDGTEKSIALTYNKDLIDVKIKDADSTNLKFDANTSTFKVTNAKTSYTVDVALENKTLMEWTTAGDIQDKSLEIKIKKKQITKPTQNYYPTTNQTTHPP